MEPHRKREHAARGLSTPSVDNTARVQFVADMKAVAGTQAGKRILSWILRSGRDATSGCFGDWRDYFILGRREASATLETQLCDILPRETFLEVVYPKKEEE